MNFATPESSQVRVQSYKLETTLKIGFSNIHSEKTAVMTQEHGKGTPMIKSSKEERGNCCTWHLSASGFRSLRFAAAGARVVLILILLLQLLIARRSAPAPLPPAAAAAAAAPPAAAAAADAPADRIFSSLAVGLLLCVRVSVCSHTNG